jgi:hypothetical protein
LTNEEREIRENEESMVGVHNTYGMISLSAEEVESMV